MTSSELKRKHLQAFPDSHFFDYKAMRFFGDTMANYGVLSYDEKTWMLYRKRPVKFGERSSHFFDKETFKEVFPKVDQGGQQ
ncbi:hypothetical protein [uncultured Desulfovibrio sp.]|uniref:hypothetical protein n=1 Tax=uncultured Desulfovibrio sp. TaxID=167968 RepID=UPI00267200B3|nr:hypothetical protein [uncultured Desulfovibrio sp.]